MFFLELLIFLAVFLLAFALLVLAAFVERYFKRKQAQQGTLLSASNLLNIAKLSTLLLTLMTILIFTLLFIPEQLSINNNSYLCFGQDSILINALKYIYHHPIIYFFTLVLIIIGYASSIACYTTHYKKASAHQLIKIMLALSCLIVIFIIYNGFLYTYAISFFCN